MRANSASPCSDERRHHHEGVVGDEQVDRAPLPLASVKLRAQGLRSLTSQGALIPPTASATAAAVSGSMSLTQTTAPSWARRIAEARPMPWPAPVHEGDAALEPLEPAGRRRRHSTAPALGETTWPTMFVSSRSTNTTAAAISSGWSTRPSGSASA